MQIFRPQASKRPRSGFTLAEVAVTLVVVGVGLISVVQVLNIAKLESAQTRNLKLASELARLSLGRVGSGQFEEELASNDYIDGSYADEGYPEFSWEILVGDEVFGEPGEDSERFDSWEDEDDDEDDEETQAYQKVHVRVVFPSIREYENHLVSVQWFPWVQVYGEQDDR